ncbi:MAG TPA: GNAT family N-acetyltransferase [Gammaproteobacteria bacterium]|nr:GNAT family N-acetyltransferase [Gammaproteobacteria bacterium]
MTYQLRIARPVSNLARSTTLYSRGLGWRVLGRFEDHEGFDGVMLGVPGAGYHLELTHYRAAPVRPAPTDEDLIVLYVPGLGEWRDRCADMLAAGFEEVPPFNPYWEARGRTFRDHDGYRVVLERARWPDERSADVSVRLARPADRDALVELWERSVRATHHFLGGDDVTALRPLVAAELASDAFAWWVAESATGEARGFLGFANDAIEGLFVDPAHAGQGIGGRLVEHAQSLAAGALRVDVNEQNEAAVRFYEARGFAVVGRSPTDGAGRPFPLLHMQRRR